MLSSLVKLLFPAVASASVAVLSLCSLFGSCATTSHEARWPDGTIKATWTEDREGRLHGTREQFHSDGSLQSHIEADHGSWTTMLFYWPSGNLKMKCTSADGHDAKEVFDDLPRESEVDVSL